jgi:YebC/PmpR family DNA-binding regulatory protein
MGRVFEKRKYKMFARFDRMAKTFTRIGKEIAIAVKQNGPDPAGNPRLRLAIQNAKGANMPKDRVDAAIKRASTKEDKGFEEIVYEGYAPHGVAVLVECATDNATRTVANIRMYFNRADGTLGKTGSLDFIFERKGVFRIKAHEKDIDELELELIDYGLQDIYVDDNEILIFTAFSDFGTMQKALEAKGIEVTSALLQRIPNSTVALPEEQEDEVIHLVEKIEQDDDVQSVYHNMK